MLIAKSHVSIIQMSAPMVWGGFNQEEGKNSHGLQSCFPARKLKFLALKWSVAEIFSDYLYGRHFTVFNFSVSYLWRSFTGMGSKSIICKILSTCRLLWKMDALFLSITLEKIHSLKSVIHCSEEYTGDTLLLQSLYIYKRDIPLSDFP